jgi:hypothetical protein
MTTGILSCIIITIQKILNIHFSGNCSINDKFIFDVVSFRNVLQIMGECSLGKRAEGQKLVNQNRSDRRVTRTRENIKGALLTLLSIKKYSEITIHDIADYADCNRVTFYAHFQDKDALLDELIDEKINGLIAAMKSEEGGKTTFDLTNEVHPGGLGLFNFIYENTEFFKIFFLQRIRFRVSGTIFTIGY